MNINDIAYLFPYIYYLSGAFSPALPQAQVSRNRSNQLLPTGRLAALCSHPEKMGRVNHVQLIYNAVLVSAVWQSEILSISTLLQILFPYRSLQSIQQSSHAIQQVLLFYIQQYVWTLASPLDCKEIQPVHSKGDQSWVFIGRTDAEAETPILWPPHVKS